MKFLESLPDFLDHSYAAGTFTKGYFEPEFRD